MQFPITIGLRRSRILDGLLGLTLVLCLAASLAYPGTVIIHLGLVLLSLLLAALAGRRLTPSVTAIRLERNGDIFVCLVGAGDFFPAQLEPGATVHPWLTVIRVTMANGRRATIMATPDSQNPSDFRHLRMFMRWQANFSALGDAA